MGKLEKELISNPLLLSLIVILYRNNLRIPDSRFEIYQCCTDTLVDKWDTDRQILIEIDSEILSKKESIFADLAYWQYKILSSDNPVITHNRVLAQVAESLVRKNLADDDNNEGKAKKFLEYAQKRSIYFDNRFYHKTFLEYFAAYWIYSNCDKKYKTEERNKIIKEYCVREFWFIVLELLLNFIDNGQPDTEVIDGIIEENSNNPSSLSFLLHVLPVLKNISEKTQILVYTKTIEHILSLKTNEHKRSGSGGEKKRHLFRKIRENAKTQKQKKIIEKATINFPNKNIPFYVFIEELNSYIWRYLNIDFNEIRNTSEYQDSLEKDPYLFCRSKNHNINYFEKTLKSINLFGVDLFFVVFETWFLGDYWGSLFDRYLYNQFEPQNINSLFCNLETLEKHSLSKKRILKKLSYRRYILFLRGDSLQYLLDAIESRSEIEKVICLFLLFNHSQIFSRNWNLIDDFKTTPQIKNLFLRSKKMSGIKFLETIIKEFNISDKEIIDLLNELKREASPSSK